MADRHHPTPILRRLQAHSPNSTQIIGLLTLLISGGILLVLTGLTITASVLSLVFLSPILILTSPLWLPLLVAALGTLSLLGAAAAAVAAASWGLRYFRGQHPVGSNGVDYARSQIASTAGHVKDYAREYGGYLQSKVKDAAPGA